MYAWYRAQFLHFLSLSSPPIRDSSGNRENSPLHFPLLACSPDSHSNHPPLSTLPSFVAGALPTLLPGTIDRHIGRAPAFPQHLRHDLYGEYIWASYVSGGFVGLEHDTPIKL